MASSLPPIEPCDERRLQHALDVLRRWRLDAIKHYAQTTDPDHRARYRQRATDAEYLAFRLEQLLHPASQQNTNNEKNEENQ